MATHPPIEHGELRLLAMHANGCFRIWDPHSSMDLNCFLSTLKNYNIHLCELQRHDIHRNIREQSNIKGTSLCYIWTVRRFHVTSSTIVILHSRL
jgi:hypothetical protein